MTTPCLFWLGHVVEVVGVCNHEVKVVVVVDRAGYVVVVFVPLIDIDLAQVRSFGLGVTHLVVRLKRIEKFVEDFVFCLVALEYFRVHACAVPAFNIRQLNYTVAIRVHHVKSSFNDCRAARIHFTNDFTEEFVIVNQAIFVCVDQVEELLLLRGRTRHPVVAESLEELLGA